MSLVVAFIGSSSVYWGLRKRKLIKLKERFFEQNGGSVLQHLAQKDSSVKIFSSEALKKATKNYNESTIVGRGGYGTVYRGILQDGSVVAVKKSKVIDETQIKQFISEVVVLCQINHRNVVRLLGCCLETPAPILVYEYVKNGTLFEHLHDHEGKSSAALPWDARLRIATETAGVLAYLHSQASTPIIHRDVKSANILLDDNLNAKVSDFGASRLVPLDEKEICTLVQGTLGYLDPEYLHTSQLNEKSDVYSFGVVLVELMTGQKALRFGKAEEERSLAVYFLNFVKRNRLMEVVEERVAKEGDLKQIKRVANVAKRCLNVRGEERPYMREVAMELEGLRGGGGGKQHPWETSVALNEQIVISVDRGR